MAVRKSAAKKAIDGLPAFEQSFTKLLDRLDKDPELVEQLTAPQEGNPRNLGPRVKSADDWVADQLAGTQAAGDKWLRGVRAPRKDPVAEAKKANTKYKNKVTEALREDRFLKGLEQVDEAAMMDAIEKCGASGFTAGVSRREAKIKGRVAELQPMIAALAAELDRMPVDTREQREAKMIAAKRGMEAIGKKRRGITS